MKLLICLLALCIATGCVSPQEKAIRLTQDAGWRWDIVPAGNFDLATAQPAHQHTKMLWVYLEGDGRAYLSPTRASSDPTPSPPVALELALKQSNDAAYLARPCQYTMPHARGCAKPFWTNARYAQEVIDSMNEAISALKQNAGANKVILVGYSGGGGLAILAAASRSDVKAIITIAANLDLAYWTQQHNKLGPLNGSVDPVSVVDKVAAIPQVHFTGGRDHVTGTDVVQSFINHLPAHGPVHLVTIPEFTHSCCWVEHWPALLEQLALRLIAP